MRKMTGYEYKQFISADWDALLGVTGAYMDDTEITVNGVNEDTYDSNELIPDASEVKIHSGFVGADADIDLSLEKCYDKWKKGQTHTVVVVSVLNEQLEEFKAYVKGLK